VIDVDKILLGEEHRTTVMIRHTPNKMQYAEIIRLLQAKMHQQFDFVYLRVDFDNGNNVGYCFVNFLDMDAVLDGINLFKHHSWKIYGTNKVVELSFASCQGFDALVTKFRDSAVGAQWHPYRPHIFRSP